MTRSSFCVVVLAALSISSIPAAVADENASSTNYNVLFIAVDDLRPQTGAYGVQNMVTPNLDQLASQGRMFRRHFVQCPSCGPSRFSMMASRRPRNSNDAGLGAFRNLHWQVTPPDFNVIRGTLVQGGVGQLQQEDDNRLEIQPGPIVNSDEYPAWLEFEVEARNFRPEHLNVVLESQANSNGIGVEVQAWNWGGNEFQSVYSEMESVNSDVQHQISIASPTQFVHSETGLVRFRIGWHQLSPAVFYPWTVAIDRLFVETGNSTPNTLPQAFRVAGYNTVGLGKLSHVPDGGSHEMANTWNGASTPNGIWDSDWDAFFAYAFGETRDYGISPRTEIGVQPDGVTSLDDTDYPDGLVAQSAIEHLELLTSCRDAAESIEGISAGLCGGDLNFIGGQWNGAANYGEYEVEGTYFVNNSGQQLSVGEVKKGIATFDSASGRGYIMYSEESLRTRFSDIHSDNADHFLAVRHNGTTWQYTNSEVVDWTNFASRPTDVLVACADFESDTALPIQDKPFFMGVGFFKPHLPFCAPKQYWDLYDRESIVVPEQTLPDGTSNSTHHGNYEFVQSYGGPDVIDEEEAKLSIHGYNACVSYIDAQIGKVLNELEVLGLAENTIVVVWGDHGYHLGDHTIWAKWTPLEESTRSCLIVRVPDQSSPGTATDSIVESIDIYPTLCELCNVQPNSNVEGTSFAQVLDDPNATSNGFALSYMNRLPTHIYSLRTDTHRLISYGPPDSPSFVELYDYSSDPDGKQNVAALFPNIVTDLLSQIEGL